MRCSNNPHSSGQEPQNCGAILRGAVTTLILTARTAKLWRILAAGSHSSGRVTQVLCSLTPPAGFCYCRIPFFVTARVSFVFQELDLELLQEFYTLHFKRRKEGVRLVLQESHSCSKILILAARSSEVQQDPHRGFARVSEADEMF